jgi:hypothetical protein
MISHWSLVILFKIIIVVLIAFLLVKKEKDEIQSNHQQ